jgi:hypothetical protein
LKSGSLNSEEENNRAKHHKGIFSYTMRRELTSSRVNPSLISHNNWPLLTYLLVYPANKLNHRQQLVNTSPVHNIHTDTPQSFTDTSTNVTSYILLTKLFLLPFTFSSTTVSMVHIIQSL